MFCDLFLNFSSISLPASWNYFDCLPSFCFFFFFFFQKVSFIFNSFHLLYLFDLIYFHAFLLRPSDIQNYFTFSL